MGNSRQLFFCGLPDSRWIASRIAGKQPPSHCLDTRDTRLGQGSSELYTPPLQAIRLAIRWEQLFACSQMRMPLQSNRPSSRFWDEVIVAAFVWILPRTVAHQSDFDFRRNSISWIRPLT